MSRLPVQKTYKLYIGGGFPRTESGRYYQVRGAKDQFVANLCRGSRKDFKMAVVAARKAQAGWAGRSAFNRGQILYRMAEMLEARSASFVELLTSTGGYGRKSAQAEVDTAIDRLIWYAGWPDKFAQVFGSTNLVASSHFNFTVPEPIGVVAVLAPENAPLLGLVSAICPALVNGNTCVAIVGGDAPHVAIEFAEVLATSDLPGGVVNIITGHRDELSSHVTGHMDVDALAVYGATQEERTEIGAACADSVKRVHYYNDPTAGGWRSDREQSPYRIMDLTEFKTAWHPIGT